MVWIANVKDFLLTYHLRNVKLNLNKYELTQNKSAKKINVLFHYRHTSLTN